ncbi:cell wall anchor protein [Bacillus cereus]|uniref:SpaA isopeptide-forming pilin-related protein n=1 Tax=Bacillus nitratireducens TaxID=2026193 RepID=UPI000BEE26F2|nr:SpaA isopeptide-forming pilin-related protein [Bacillus nitratireducens]PEB83661.1 cell wall anchor protein [Bacillus cereus]
MNRKMLTKWFGIISLIIMLLGVSMPQAAAEIIHQEKFQMNWNYIKFKGTEVKVKSDFLRTSSKDVAYCLSPELNSPNGDNLSEIGKEDDFVYRVLLYGYPQKTPAELGVSTKEEAYYATQLAIWIASKKIELADSKTENQQIYNLVKHLVEKASKGTEVQETYLNIIPTGKQTVEKNGDYFETNLYMVQSNAVSGVYSVQIEDAPEGVQIINEQGEKKNEFSIKENFKVLIPKNTPSGNFKLRVNTKLQSLQAVIFDGQQRVQNTTALLPRTSEKSSADIVVKWETLGSLKIMKVGENREVLKGAVFEVVSENGNFIKEITTAENGIATLNNLPTDTYVIKEIQAPEGYVLDPTIKKLEVKTGEIAEIKIKNRKIKSELEIKKVHATYENAKQSYDTQSKEHIEEKDLASKEKHYLPSAGTKLPTPPFVGLGFIILGIYILKTRKYHG